MTVGDLIAELGTFDPDLPVCIADWNEEYASPSEAAAQFVTLSENAEYYPVDRSKCKNEHTSVGIGTFVCIGNGD